MQATILPNNPEDALRPQNAPNPDLRWEKTQNVNVGMDLSLWDNAISLSVDYYYRKGTDLIGMRMLPLETGYSSTTVNWASMKTKVRKCTDHTEHPHQRFHLVHQSEFRFQRQYRLTGNSSRKLQPHQAGKAIL